MSKKIKLGVIFGGVSPEHEVSLASAANVIEAARAGNFEVVEIGITKTGRWVVGNGALVYLCTQANARMLPTGMDEVALRFSNNIPNLQETLNIGNSSWISSSPKINAWLEKQLSISNSSMPTVGGGTSDVSNLDVIFPLIHGRTGEDGAIQGFCRLLDVPVVGCDVLASAVCMDKVMTKQVLASAGVPQSEWMWLYAREIDSRLSEVKETISKKLGGYPVFVKPSNTGSSVGISKVKTEGELKSALDEASKHDSRILIEEAIKGRELEIGILGWEDFIVSPEVSEIIPTREFYDYDAKYIESDTTTIELPAKIDRNVVERIQTEAKKAFRSVDGAGFARIDFFYNQEVDQLYLNEINTLPGFTKISQYPALMKTAGLSYLQLIEKLVQIAIESHADRRAHR